MSVSKGTIKMKSLRTPDGISAFAGSTAASALTFLGSSICIATTAALVTSFAAPASAQTQLYDGGKARVNLSARLRSLTEEIASASCRFTAGIDTETARSDLEKVSAEFDTIISGLADGSPALGIPSKEQARENLASINAVQEAWAPIRASAVTMLTGAASPAELAVVDQAYKPLLETTNALTSRISGHYSNPQELLQSDAITLDYLVRQRMFVSRMVRALCGLATGTPDMGNVEELKEAVGLFDISLVALRDGFPSAGINPPRNEAVKSSLVSTYEAWSERKSMFDDALNGGQVEQSLVSEAAELAKTMSTAINNTITLYLISSPGQEGVYRVPLQAYSEDELSKWIENPELIAAINAQNVEHANLSQAQVDQLDLDWRAQVKDGGGPLITQLLSHPVSEWLRNQQSATAGFVTEVFVMDNKGLNVAQSVETSDYWQGDEAKWQETYGDGSGAGNLHISEVEFDDSTGFYQSQASLPITDPATGSLIGAITFGINVQSLM